MLKLQLCQSGVPYDRHLTANKLCSVISYLLKRLNHDNICFWFVLFDIAVSSIRIPRGCLDPIAWKRPAEYHLRIMLCSNAILKKPHRIKAIPEKEKKALRAAFPNLSAGCIDWVCRDWTDLSRNRWAEICWIRLKKQRQLNVFAREDFVNYSLNSETQSCPAQKHSPSCSFTWRMYSALNRTRSCTCHIQS